MGKNKINVVLWILAVIFTFITIIIGLVGYYSFGFRGFNLSKSSVEVIDEQNLAISDINSVGVKLMSTSTTDGKVVKATVTGVEGVDKTLSWSIAWALEDNWNKGKDVSQYVSIIINADTLSVIVKDLQPFNSAILLKAISNSRNDVSATCTLQYVKKIQQIEDKTSEITIPILVTNSSTKQKVAPLNIKYSEGTLDPSIFYSVEYQFSNSMINTINDTLKNNGLTVMVNRKKTRIVQPGAIVNLSLDIQGDLIGQSADEKAKNIVNDLLIDNSGNFNWYVLTTIKYYLKYDNQTYQVKELNLGNKQFDTSNLTRLCAQTVELDNSQLVF